MTLDLEDKKSPAIFFCHNLVTVFSFTETQAAEYGANMVYKSNRTVRKWYSDMVSNNGILPESMQGLYQWTDVLWSNEDLTANQPNIFGKILQ